MINDNIEITIVEAKNGVCKVAIKADKDVKIYREEIYLQIKLANLIGKIQMFLQLILYQI